MRRKKFCSYLLSLVVVLTILGISIPIAIAIAILLGDCNRFISADNLCLSLAEVGPYVVARDNLGELPAQIAASALLTDYILTVAVSISSGVAQITSAFPELLPFKVEIAVGVIVLMTVVNLRGIKESGHFAIPTYFFLGMMFLTLAIGAICFFTGTLGVVTGRSYSQYRCGATGAVPYSAGVFQRLYCTYWY
ncbi:MAG: hypothetical protein R3E39_02885 [Anaerolineae bacterium]